MELENRRVLVVGAGKSGISAAKLLIKKKAKVLLYDGNQNLDQLKLRAADPLLKELPIIAGEFTEEAFQFAEIVVMSPGVPTDLPFVDKLRKAGRPIWGEIELAYRLGKGKVIGITGTNGKTTTTTLVGEIMASYFSHTQVVGNIGIPYTDVVDELTEDTITVAEISSFQLETTEEFHPHVTAILNIQPDHLNRHHTMECYVSLKESITKKQTKEDFCVLNYDNHYTREFGERAPAIVIYFSSTQELKNGYFYRNGNIFFAENGIEKQIMNIKDMNLVGMCNVENVMAAIAMSTAMGVPESIILSVVKKFKAVEHRIEFVATKRNVDYYNDSKGTNPDAAIQGIRAMSKPTILIGGGYDKGSEYDEWIQAFDNKVKLFVLLGATKEKIAETARKYGVNQIKMANTFEEAFQICVENAQPGDAVLLSPACASWGMFDNYEQRGKVFKDLVKAIKE